METISFEITGNVPLLMHADTLSNPLHPATKEHKKLTSVRKKTDEIHEAMAVSEWRAGMYYNDEIGVHIPGENVEACLREAAKIRRLGTSFKRAVMVSEISCKLRFPDEGKTLDQLEKKFLDYSFTKSVVVSRARIMRVRPMFKEWAIECSVSFFPDVVDREQILQSAQEAGLMVGLCDWRPRFGRFDIKEIK